MVGKKFRVNERKTNFLKLFIIVMKQFFVNLFSSFFLQARNSILTRIASTFQGLPTIHATRSERVLMDEFHRNVDLNTSAMYLNYAASRAFAFWLDVVGAIYISVVMFGFLMSGGDGEIFDYFYGVFYAIFCV
jgi:hypothetical protein